LSDKNYELHNIKLYTYFLEYPTY